MCGDGHPRRDVETAGQEIESHSTVSYRHFTHMSYLTNMFLAILSFGGTPGCRMRKGSASWFAAILVAGHNGHQYYDW